MSKVRGSRMNHVYRLVNRKSEIDADVRVLAIIERP